mmetsp:Transcript_86250/g.225020  ORF Transcript_86250/g.225020 Transcript_86250/m.225020 type:complete len:215 (-) Transcript_86250:936-1580(-)
MHAANASMEVVEDEGVRDLVLLLRGAHHVADRPPAPIEVLLRAAAPAQAEGVLQLGHAAGVLCRLPPLLVEPAGLQLQRQVPLAVPLQGPDAPLHRSLVGFHRLRPHLAHDGEHVLPLAARLAGVDRGPEGGRVRRDRTGAHVPKDVQGPPPLLANGEGVDDGAVRDDRRGQVLRLHIFHQAEHSCPLFAPSAGEHGDVVGDFPWLEILLKHLV